MEKIPKLPDRDLQSGVLETEKLAFPLPDPAPPSSPDSLFTNLVGGVSQMKPSGFSSKKSQVLLLQGACPLPGAGVAAGIFVVMVKMKGVEGLRQIDYGDILVAGMPNHPVVPGAMADREIRHSDKFVILV